MSVADQFIRNHSNRGELIKKGKAARFFGERVGSLTKDDLFMMIGLLGVTKARDEETRRRDWATAKSYNLGRPRYL
jgi:hypothetical protein